MSYKFIFSNKTRLCLINGFDEASKIKGLQPQDFSHLKRAAFDTAFPKRFERLSSKELADLASADLIVAAGIDFDGEAALDSWRRTLPHPPGYLRTWTEAYATVGHAVLLYGGASILAGFDEEERPTFRLTDWPEESGSIIVEAECGNVFQPHGVVDLHNHRPGCRACPGRASR